MRHLEGEATVAVSLSNFGIDTSVLSPASPPHEIGQMADNT
jgi:hypothetical protein